MQLDRYLLLHPDAIRYMKNRWEQRHGRGCVLSSWQPLTALGTFYRFLRSKTLDTAHWRIYRPTTGALLLLTALQLCDQVKLCRRSPGDLGKPLCVFLACSVGQQRGWLHTPWVEGAWLWVHPGAHTQTSRDGTQKERPRPTDTISL